GGVIVTGAPVFIVGCPRSGTTLLRNLLRAHPNLAIPDESHFIPAFYRKFGDPATSEEAIRIARDILRLQFIVEWDLDLNAQAFAGCRSFREIVDRLFSAWAAAKGKPRWGDKTPHYARHMPLLAELFPQCRIIHILRDGRDVALSWLRIGFGPNNLYSAARAWERSVRAARNDSTLLPEGSYCEIRFEDLVANPESALREICTFIGESFDPAVLKPSPLPESGARRYSYTPNPLLGVDQAVRRRSGIISSNTGGWREMLSDAEKLLFDSTAGELLEEIGYETGSRRRQVSGIEHLAWGVDNALKWVWVRLRSSNKRRWLLTDIRLRLAVLQGWFSGRLRS
ncbi:MAG: sulfotransferase, partial [Candidatus Binatia bacterium]